MGQDPHNSNFWLTIEGERYSDYDLQSGWVFLNTYHTENVPEKPDMKNVFKDLGTTPASLTPVPETTDFGSTQFNVISDIPPSLPHNHNESIEIVKKSIEEEILNKCHIETINKENFDKHGIETKLRPKLVDIDLSIEIPYNIDRLKKSVKLLDLDVNKIAKILTKHILQLNIGHIIEYRLYNLLLELGDKEQVSNVTSNVPDIISVDDNVSDSDYLHDLGSMFFNK
jgi:hypothetical protein